MESLDYWRLCDELSIIQAALLLAESDPGGENGYAENWQVHQRPHGYEAAKTGITNAFRRGAIKGRLIPNYEYDINGNQCGEIDDSINLVESRVDVESLREWLTTRGIRTGFFFPDASNNAPDYLDPSHPRYAPKLAAAIKVWLAMEDENLRRTKRAYSASEQWLQINYRELGLMHEKDNPKNGTKAGDPNSSAIGMIANIVNWEPSGGATKTPGE